MTSAPEETSGESAGERDRSTRQAVGRATLILMLGNLVGSMLGFGRQFIIAKVYGPNYHTDAFVAASIVPQMFYDLSIGAAVSAALIPTFTEMLERRGREALWQTLGPIFVLVWIVMAVVVGILFLAARPLMMLILLGWHMHATDLNTAIEIARILIPTLFFLGTSAVLLATLYSLRRFTAPAFAPSCYHLGIIAGAVILARPLGILALPVGALAGAAAQAAAQVPALWRERPRLTLRLSLTPEIRRIIRLYAPVAAGLLISVAGQIIDMDFKSQLASGGIFEMQNATTLTQFPIGIAVSALSFAVLPSISSDAAFNRIEDFKDTLAAGMRLVLFLTIPAAIGYLVLATPIVSLVFQHGKYHPQATAAAASALVGYAIQIPFVGIDQLLIFSFYARKNTVTPMLIGVVGVCIYVVSAWFLLPALHIFGLALANTLQNSLHGLILLGLLIAAIGPLGGRGLVSGVSKSLVAGAAMAGVSGGLAWILAPMLNRHLLPGQALEALLPIMLGAAAYFGVAALLRSPELGEVWQIARSRRRAA